MQISLMSVLASSLGIWAVIKYILLPYMSSLAKKDRTPATITKHIIVNLLGFGSLFFILIAISSALSLMLIKIIGVMSSNYNKSIDTLNDSLEFLHKTDALVSSVTYEWTIVTMIVLVVALIIISYRGAKKSIEEQIESKTQKELERLQKEYDNGEWKELPPNEEMSQAYLLLEEYDKKLDELENVEDGDEDTINSLINNKNQLVEYIELLDIQRRINIDLDKEEPVKIKTFKDKIATFFISEGLLRTVNGFAFLLFIVGILLLIPLMITFASGEAKKEIASLEQLQININSKRIQKEFKKLNTSHASVADIVLSTEDEKTLDELANSFENQVLYTRIVNPKSVKVAKDSAVVMNSVKELILEQHTRKNKNIKVHKSKSMPEPIKKMSSFAKESIKSNKPVTNIGKQFRQDLKKQIFTNNPKTWNHYKNLVTKATKSFQVPATARNIKANLISSTIGNIMQTTNLNGASGKVFGALSEMTSGTAKELYLSESRRYMMELSKADYMDDALKKMADIKYKPLATTQMKNMKSYVNNIPKVNNISKYSSGLHRISEPHINMIHAQQKVKNIAKLSGNTRSIKFADALASFDDFFPSYQGAEKHTARGKTLANTSTSGYSGKQTKASSSNAYKRSRSYARLRGFSRIGGVLIGKMPDNKNNTELNITNISWKRDKSNIILYLTQNNKNIKIGKFNPAIVYLALGYVADGRVTAVTMVSADPLYDLKILLHPVLVDTGLGCRAIKLDQIADETTSKYNSIATERSRENINIDNFVKIYTYAWAIRIKKIISNYPRLKNEILDYVKYSDEILDTYSGEVGKILKSKKFNISFAKNKTEFFDIKLINAIDTCKNKSKFGDCLRSNLINNNPTTDVSWLNQTPTLVEWSGVREQSYKLDRSLSFLKLDSHDEIWPFRFMVQKVFTSEPEFVADKDSYTDDNPYEFVKVNKKLMKSIKKELVKNKVMRGVVDDMREFAILQRLFRLAFENRLGDNFPIKKLMDLATETNKEIDSGIRTIRWLPKPGALEKVAQYEILNGGDRDKIEKILTLKQALRVDLGIPKDEEQLQKNTSGYCPKP